MTRRHRPVRPVFRILAWILGPLLIAAGALLMVLDLLGRHPHGSPIWTTTIHAGMWLGVGNMILGYVILRAARTGRDPYVEPQSGEEDPGGR